MSAKQDRQGVRTAQQLEQKWKFGESFAEVMGIATDARNAATGAAALAEKLNGKLTQEEIFNILTNNGQLQGLYRGEDGELYINASYIKSGELFADLIKTGVLTSKNGLTQFNLDKDIIVCANTSGRSATIQDGSVSVTDGTSDIDIGNGWITFTVDNKLVGYIHGYTGRLVFNGGEIQCPRINPGKDMLYEGSVSKGSSFSVPYTANYDLFAIRLDSDYVVPYIVLAYKWGGCIRGVGGWAGDSSTPKELAFVNITYSGDTWTLVDANKQPIGASGSVGTATSLSLTQVKGVI